jgi:hypothetical protein
MLGIGSGSVLRRKLVIALPKTKTPGKLVIASTALHICNEPHSD